MTTVAELLSGDFDLSFLDSVNTSPCINMYSYHFNKQVTIRDGKVIQNDRLLMLLASIRRYQNEYSFDAELEALAVRVASPERGLVMVSDKQQIARKYKNDWSHQKVSIVILS